MVNLPPYKPLEHHDRRESSLASYKPWDRHIRRKASLEDEEPLEASFQRHERWRAWRDSNPQPTDSKSGTLSIELQAQRIVYHNV
jgi:hypothetical protein